MGNGDIGGAQVATYVEIWTWKAPVQAAVEPLDLTGYDVEAADGHIGKIDEASKQTGNSSIVVDTDPIFTCSASLSYLVLV